MSTPPPVTLLLLATTILPSARTPSDVLASTSKLPVNPLLNQAEVPPALNFCTIRLPLFCGPVVTMLPSARTTASWGCQLVTTLDASPPDPKVVSTAPVLL